MDKSKETANEISCEICLVNCEKNLICQKCVNSFLNKTQCLKRNRRIENNTNFEVIANRLSSIKGNKNKSAIDKNALEKEIEFRKISILKKESMIKLLKEKKNKLTENLEMLKENIAEKRKMLETAKKELIKEKYEEKNYPIVLNNIKKNTFTLVIE